MAEAHSAVAFSVTVTHEGLNINYDWELFVLILKSGLRSWSKKIDRFKNNLKNGVYPGSLHSLILAVALVSGLYFLSIDISYGTISILEKWLPGHILGLTFGLLVFGILLWLFVIQMLKSILKLLLMYKGWMYEKRGKNSKISGKTRMWMAAVRFLSSRKPLLYSFQSSLPRMPVPSLDNTLKRYLKSMQPLKTGEEFKRTEQLAEEFKNGIGKKLQFYLKLKSLWVTNYVTDWWEEYVYLQSRSPIMVNSNFYGIDTVLKRDTIKPAARAANIVYASLKFRRLIDRQSLEPIKVGNLVPLCSWQYERLFNTCRIPCLEKDKIAHCLDSGHIVVMNKGKFYKVIIHHKGELLQPAELQIQMEMILNDASEPAPGEKYLGAVTAADRTIWANARCTYFRKGLNNFSLQLIEKAAFVLCLDDEPYFYDPDDPTKLSMFGRNMLHGTGYNRWFDKSFNLVVGSNGKIGFNGEHAWADAPIMSHYWEYLLIEDNYELGYNEDGNVKGTARIKPAAPVRLQWDLPEECRNVIMECKLKADILLNDVDLEIHMHSNFGKGLMKSCRVSPDAFIQMGLQLAYYRDQGSFQLTYEASMTRLFKEGRTETIRTVTMESCDWVRSMLNENLANKERKELFIKACDLHQYASQEAMSGKGVDRHLFCLYVISSYLDVDSPFLKEFIAGKWKLSTSQTPHGQTKAILPYSRDCISAGGGFGPVADDGYGVSYVIAGEDIVFFHVSSKKSMPNTNSLRFVKAIGKALNDIKVMFEDTQ